MEYRFERIAIVNRGASAIRVIRAIRELNREQHLNLSSVALFTEPDRQALFVREADDAVCIGPAAFIDQRDGQRKSSYLDLEQIEQALIIARVDVAWVSWGPLAEESQFEDLCKRLGIVFIGPNAETLRLLGDKISTKRLAQQADIPVVPWSGRPIETEAEAWRYAEQLGYPLMIKTAVGSGEHDIQRVSSPPELPNAFEIVHDLARQSSGAPIVFLERIIGGAHHLEVQVIADTYGTTWAVGVHDCTVRRRSQKLLLESGSRCCCRSRSANYVRPRYACASSQAASTPEPLNSCTTPVSTSSGSWSSTRVLVTCMRLQRSPQVLTWSNCS